MAAQVASFFGFGPSADIAITFKDAEKMRKFTKSSSGHTVDQYFLLTNWDTIAGTISITPSEPIQMLGIKVEFFGLVELLSDNSTHIFTSLVRDLDNVGTISSNKTYNFEFVNVEKPYETYTGVNAKLRYYLRVSILRQYTANITKEIDFVVQNLNNNDKEVAPNSTLSMEVGIEDCLHIEFSYNKTRYSLNDIVEGKIYFLLVRIKIKHMELQILRRESTGTGQNALIETDVITKFEIMDGAPIRGEIIPIRLFLSPFDLTPTMKNIHSKFSVKYYLNLVLIDEEERRYFKQQEIILYRTEFKYLSNPGSFKLS